MTAKLGNLPEIAVLAGITIIGIIVLAATSHPADATLDQLALVLGGAAAGIAINPKAVPAPPVP